VENNPSYLSHTGRLESSDSASVDQAPLTDAPENVSIFWASVRTVLTGLSLSIAIAMVVWIWNMDQRITSTFAQSLTAQKGLVYAKSVTLVRDKVMPLSELEAALKDLGYQSSESPQTPATYRIDPTPGATNIALVTRPFDFVDSKQDSRPWFRQGLKTAAV